MDSILQNDAIDKLPVAELTATLNGFMEPVVMHLPEKRLREVGKLAVQGILGGQSPLVTQIARGVAREDETVWPMAKRLYRFIWNPRFSHRDLLKGLYGIAQRTVAEHSPSHLVVALDPVNFEKPYTEDLEGVSTVMKSTPPGPRGEKRLTMEKRVILSMKEQMRLKVVTEIEARRITGPEAAKVLRLSLRQVRRIVAAYRKEGAASLAHGNRGRVSPSTLQASSRSSLAVPFQTAQELSPRVTFSFTS